MNELRKAARQIGQGSVARARSGLLLWVKSSRPPRPVSSVETVFTLSTEGMEHQMRSPV